MAPHLAAARATTLYAPACDHLGWPRGHPADGSDDEKGLKADGALSQQAVAFLDACAEEPDGDRRLALARRAYAAAPTAKKARRAYALALATSKRWGLLADLLEKWDVASTFGDGGVASRAAACGLRFASRYGAAELAAPGDVALGAAQAAAKRAGDAFFAVGHFAEAAEAYGRGVAVAAHPTLSCDRAAALVAAGDFQGALASYDAAVEANPSCWRCRWARARCAGAVAVLFGVLIYAKAQNRSANVRRRKASPSTTTTTTSAASRPRARAPRPRARPRWRTSRSSGASTFSPPSRRYARPRRPPSPRSKSGGARRKRARGRVDGRRARPTLGRRPPGPSGRTTTSSEFRETPAPPRSAGPTGKRP